MIEKLKDTIILQDGCPTGVKPNNDQIVTAINEIIDKVNELDIKLHTVKLFTPTQDKAVKELLKLLETDNSVGDVINGNDSERLHREKDEGDTLQQ